MKKTTLFIFNILLAISVAQNITTGCYILEAANLSSKVYISNIEDGVVEAGAKVSVWTFSDNGITGNNTFALESQSTDLTLSSVDDTTPLIQTDNITTPSTKE